MSLDFERSFAIFIIYIRKVVPRMQNTLQKLAIEVFLTQHADLSRLLHLHSSTEQVAEGLLHESLSSELSDHLVFEVEATPIAERGSYLSLGSTLLTELQDVQLTLPLENIASERTQDSDPAEFVSLSFPIFLGIEMLL